jgi:hypothetical protein
LSNLGIGFETGKFSHYAARKLAEWRPEAECELPIPTLNGLEFRFALCQTVEQAEELETELLRRYKNRFGELPPLR